MKSNTDTPSIKLDHPALVLDASSKGVFVGLVGANKKWLYEEHTSGTVLEELFNTTERVLNQCDCDISEIKNFIYCEGPGSVLGLRLCAMAINTWCCIHTKPVSLFAYNSLQLTAALIGKDRNVQDKSLLVADWRKDAWHALHLSDETPGQLEIIDDATLSNCEMPVYYLPQRYGWQQPPENAILVEYSPQRLLSVIHESGLLKKTGDVELYTTGTNNFKKWTPQRHRKTT